MVNPSEYERKREAVNDLVSQADQLGLDVWEDEDGEMHIALGFNQAELDPLTMDPEEYDGYEEGSDEEDDGEFAPVG